MNILVSEWLRTKRTAIRWLTFFMPFFVAVCAIIYITFRKGTTQEFIFEGFFTIWTAVKMCIRDRDNTSDEKVVALIEVKVTPQRGMGFDKIAERIYQYSEVESVYLMSGAYDFTVFIEGRTMRQVAQFVSEKLSPMESVLSTATPVSYTHLDVYKRQAGYHMIKGGEHVSD